MKQKIHDILSLGISHIETIRKQLTELKLTEADEPGSERYIRASYLLTAAAAINDVIHPAYPLAPEVFEDSRLHDLLKYYEDLHNKYLADKKIECPCESHISPNSDQAEQI